MAYEALQASNAAAMRSREQGHEQGQVVQVSIRTRPRCDASSSKRQFKSEVSVRCALPPGEKNTSLPAS